MNRALSEPFISVSRQNRRDAAITSVLNNLIDQTNSLVSVGAILPSGPSIILTSRIHHVSGTAQIKNIIAPTGFTGGDIILIPDGTWTAATGGNIGKAYTATQGIPAHVVFDGSLWWLR